MLQKVLATSFGGKAVYSRIEPAHGKTQALFTGKLLSLGGEFNVVQVNNV